MSDYTPTTEEVRDAFAEIKEDDFVGWFKAEAGFDRWLAEVKAQAWQEGYKQGSLDNYGSSSDVKYADNHYRKGEK